MNHLNENNLKIAVIGSGPSGFYAAEELLSQKECAVSVDMFDRLPTPFGLVRGGVAPDHAKIKTVTKVYEKTASHPRFRFFGNVEFGKDIRLKDIRNFYHAVIFAVGAKSDRRMEIPGEDLAGSVPATNFVGWYNGHPDYRHFTFDLSCERIAVVGNGNVAMDVTRILAVDPKELEPTDIAEYALEALKQSKIKEIYILGRRGPAQAAFTNPEIRELCNLKGADLIADPNEISLDELSQASIAEGTGGITAKNNVQILADQSKKPLKNEPRKIIVRFLVSPVEVLGKDGAVCGVKLEKNKLIKDKDGTLRPKGTGETEILNVGMILRSVGYKGMPVEDIPYDNRKGTIPNEQGRIFDPQTKKTLTGLYAVGWAKRGPTGVIGTNKPDSIETAKILVEDFKADKIPSPPEKDADGILTILKEKGVQVVTYGDWKFLDQLEIQKGVLKKKIREKFTTIAEMMAALKNKS